MLKKIETFLAIMLAICAVLLLMAAGSGQPVQKGEETTEPVVQTTAPEAQTEPRADTQPQTEPQGDTGPQTEPMPQETAPAGTVPVSQVRVQVERILDRAALEQTAVTRRVHDSGLGASGNTAGLAGTSHAAALAEVAEGRKMNPVAAFWELVTAGLYDKQSDGAGKLSTAALQPPEQAAKQYAYTNDGARGLLTDILTLAARMDDGLDLELAMLGANTSVEPDQIFYSEAEQCRYAYFSCVSERTTYILCFYLRGGEQIDDVELQLLYLRHASGDAESLTKIDREAQKQAASLMAAAELLMTGKTRAGEGEIPFSYQVGGMQASLERFLFSGDPDRGSLVNYRLRMK